MNGSAHEVFVRPPARLALAAVVAGGLLYVAGQYVASQPQRVSQHTLTVSGQGMVDAVPDVARVELGLATGAQPSAKAALEILSTKFTAVLKAVQEAGVPKEDLTTTNLSLTPRYDFPDGRQVLQGFEASESVRLKIRDLDKIGSVLAAATGQGANQIGGIAFDIDEPSELQRRAEEAAIADARKTAERLARAMGVGLGAVQSFSVIEPFSPPPFPYAAERADLGIGGGAPPVPPVPSGTREITATVSVTYTLR